MCRVGGRSAQVTQYLVQQGIDAVNVDGGMLAWDGAGRPMVTDNGTPGLRSLTPGSCRLGAGF